MYIPLHYQVSEYDCVPTAFINGMVYLFQRKEIPPMVIRHIYLYSLDTVGRDTRFWVKGTSRYGVCLLGNWLNSYKLKQFSVTTEFLDGERVHLRQDGGIASCLEDGGIALCNVLLNRREEHYIMVMRQEGGWVYCFDSYRRISLRGMRGRAGVLDPEDGRSANLRIRAEWMDRIDSQRFCLGPFPVRECLLIRRNT